MPYAMFIAEVAKVGVLKFHPMITPDSYNLLMVDVCFKHQCNTLKYTLAVFGLV